MSLEAGKPDVLAALILNYRALSENALSERLKRKGFSAGVIEPVLSELKDLRLIDDSELAKSMAHARLKNQKHGAFRIRQDMAKRGIQRAMADEALKQAETELAGEVPDEIGRAY